MIEENMLIRTILGVIFALLLSLSLTITIYTRSSVDILSNRDQMKEILTDEEIQYELIEYIINKAFSPLALEVADKILGEEKYSELIHSELVEESAETITNNTIDTLYDWAEGEIDSPELVLKDKNKEDLIENPLNAFLDENLNFLSDLIDVGDLIESNESLTLIDISPEKIVGLQKTYQTIQKIPQIALFITFVFGALTLISLKKWRHRMLLVGLAILGSGAILMWGESFISYQSISSSKILEVLGYSLPSLESLPKFLQLTLNMAGVQIIEQSKNYSLYFIISGAILAILSQIALKDVSDIKHEIEENDSEEYEIDEEVEMLEEE